MMSEADEVPSITNLIFRVNPIIRAKGNQFIAPPRTLV